MFPQQINKPSKERIFSNPKDVCEPVLREGVQQVRNRLCHSRGQGVAPFDLSVVSEVLMGNTIILELESPHPCSLRRTRILVGVLAQSVEDKRSPVRKWWKERVMSVIVLPSWFPNTQPHGPAGTCSRRKRNVGEAHGLIIISLFSKSNTKENPSFVSKSSTATVIW